MEDVQDIYQQPYNPRYPTVCMDELSKQLVGEVAAPLPLKPGQPMRCGYAYERHGAAHLFMFFEPLVGQRFVQVTDQRTKTDWAYAVREVLDVPYPDAARITLVIDNLNTCSLGSLYEAFEPTEAKRIADSLEVHHTPKHRSWLNMAEIELGVVLSRQCLGRRIPDHPTLKHAVNLGQSIRNEANASVDWRFTTADARIKLKRLYPSIHES